MVERKPYTVEELARTNAYEARMHFLLPKNGYATQRVVVSEPTVAAVEKYFSDTPPVGQTPL